MESKIKLFDNKNRRQRISGKKNMKNQDFIKIMENEIVNLQTEYKEIIRDMKKNGYDFNKDRRRAQIDHTISALNIAIKEYNRL